MNECKISSDNRCELGVVLTANCRKLNIGCGNKKINGYVSVDIRNDVDADIIIDLEKIPYPLEGGSIDEILANDIIEHFSYRTVEDVVREWHRILTSGGMLRIKTPDFENIINILKRDGLSFIGGTASLVMGDEHKTWAGISHWLYGGQDYAQNYHKMIFTKIELKKFLEYIGFEVDSIVDDKECGTNMICVARKQ
jgi:predicted SAM-dependent methyltransferase